MLDNTIAFFEWAQPYVHALKSGYRVVQGYDIPGKAWSIAASSWDTQLSFYQWGHLQHAALSALHYAGNVTVAAMEDPAMAGARVYADALSLPASFSALSIEDMFDRQSLFRGQYVAIQYAMSWVDYAVGDVTPEAEKKSPAAKTWTNLPYRMGSSAASFAYAIPKSLHHFSGYALSYGINYGLEMAWLGKKFASKLADGASGLQGYDDYQFVFKCLAALPMFHQFYVLQLRLDRLALAKKVLQSVTANTKAPQHADPGILFKTLQGASQAYNGPNYIFSSGHKAKYASWIMAAITPDLVATFYPLLMGSQPEKGLESIGKVMALSVYPLVACIVDSFVKTEKKGVREIKESVATLTGKEVSEVTDAMVNVLLDCFEPGHSKAYGFLRSVLGNFLPGSLPFAPEPSSKPGVHPTTMDRLTTAIGASNSQQPQR